MQSAIVGQHYAEVSISKIENGYVITSNGGFKNYYCKDENEVSEKIKEILLAPEPELKKYCDLGFPIQPIESETDLDIIAKKLGVNKEIVVDAMTKQFKELIDMQKDESWKEESDNKF